MSILEYDYNGHMQVIREEGKEDGYVEGVKAGEARGEARGKEVMLRSLIEKKIQKGKALAQIADELEETEEAVRPIYDELVAGK